MDANNSVHYPTQLTASTTFYRAATVYLHWTPAYVRRVYRYLWIKLLNDKELLHINPLNPELNPICYLLALLGAHHFLHVSRIRVKLLTFRLLMSYIYMEHPFLMFLDHTQRRNTVGRTPLDEWSARRRDLYLTTHNTHNRQISMPPPGFETHDLRRRAAADLRLRPRGHWDRQNTEIKRLICSLKLLSSEPEK